MARFALNLGIGESFAGNDPAKLISPARNRLPTPSLQLLMKAQAQVAAPPAFEVNAML